MREKTAGVHFVMSQLPNDISPFFFPGTKAGILKTIDGCGYFDMQTTRAS